MKINEKNLVSYAVSNQSIDKEGWLLKRSDSSRNFQKRYFVLKGNMLFYFDKPGDKEPIGVIILEGCTVDLVDDEQYSFKIEFHGSNNRAYYLGADSQEIMEQWMKAIACAGYDYMKLVVAQLRQQLSELEEQTLALIPVDNLPTAPPRNRHNPFSKSEATCSNNGITDQNHGINNKLSFRNIHMAIGRPILLALDKWERSQQKPQQKSNASDDLILF